MVVVMKEKEIEHVQLNPGEASDAQDDCLLPTDQG